MSWIVQHHEYRIVNHNYFRVYRLWIEKLIDRLACKEWIAKCILLSLSNQFLYIHIKVKSNDIYCENIVLNIINIHIVGKTDFVFGYKLYI